MDDLLSTIDPEFAARYRKLQMLSSLGQGFMQSQPATGAHVGGTYVAASPLEHLSGALGKILGAVIVNKAQSGQSDLASQIQGKRQDYMQAMQSAQQPVQAPPMPSPSQQFATPMLGAPDSGIAPLADKTQLEGDQQSKLQTLLTQGMLSGDPAISGYAQHVPQMQLQAANLQRSRLEQAVEQQKMAQAGPQAALGGMTPSTYELLTNRKKASQVGINPITGQPYSKTGPVTDTSTTTPPGPAYDKRLDPMLKSLRDDLDASISRGGALKGNQERLNAAQRLLTLAVDPLTGGPANLTPQQMSEVSNSLATLIGGGGSSEGSRRELTPYTKGRTLAETMQWLTDKPQGADQQAFVKQMTDTAKREQGTAETAIRNAQAQRLPLHSQLFQLFPEQAQNALSGYGFEPGSVDLKSGKYTPKAKAAAAAAATSDTVRVKFRDQLLDIPRARLQDAINDGATEVKP